jgi:hypothetical protein
MHDQRRQAPIILANPRGDATFRRAAEAAVASGIRTPGALQAALRSTYPLATVRERELSGELSRVWYVYRDGRWVGSADPVLAGRW